MTTYSISLTPPVPSGGVGTLIARTVLRAGSYPIRIINAQLSLGSVQYTTSSGAFSQFNTGTVNINHYINSTISGGNVLTPQPMREGASPSSATALYQKLTATGSTYTPGTAVSVTGSALPLGNMVMTSTTDNAPKTYQTPSDILIAPGSVFALDNQVYTSGTITFFTYMNNMQIYFDEYHLARSS